MLLQISILIIGFIILIKGANIFVDGSSHLARNFKLSKMVIGLTIVAFGTSAPEFAVSVKATLAGSGGIVLGNVVGSNILNILLILGVSSLIHDLKVKDNTVKKELPITLMITTLLVILMSDGILNHHENMLTRGDGFALILFFGIFVYYLFTISKRKSYDSNNKDIDSEYEDTMYSLPKSILYTVLGLIAIIVGSNFVVDSATFVAEAIGISERIIGLTIIALGTSLPELVTSVVATKKGEYDIAIGNIVGSNIFNIGIVLGLPIALFGNITVGAFSSIDLVFLLISAFLLFLFSMNDYKLRRYEGIIFLLVYAIYNLMILC